jgi:hypothetical protein
MDVYYDCTSSIIIVEIINNATRLMTPVNNLQENRHYGSKHGMLQVKQWMKDLYEFTHFELWTNAVPWLRPFHNRS